MKPKIAALGTLATLASASLLACGGSDHQEHARSVYNAYRTAEDSRTDPEEELRSAFNDISAGAQKLDRETVVAAAERGQDAVDEIDALLTAELEASHELEQIDAVAAHAKQLSSGLELSRQSLALTAEELEIALDDPFLDSRKKEVDDLAEESARLAVKGELAIRRADRGLALALGLEPRFDQMFVPTATG